MKVLTELHIAHLKIMHQWRVASLSEEMQQWWCPWSTFLLKWKAKDAVEREPRQRERENFFYS